MAIQISITGLTPQQQQDVGDAFDMIPGRGQLTKAQWVQLCLLRHVKSVVKGFKRQAHETALAGEQAQVDTDFSEA